MCVSENSWSFLIFQLTLSLSLSLAFSFFVFVWPIMRFLVWLCCIIIIIFCFDLLFIIIRFAIFLLLLFLFLLFFCCKILFGKLNKNKRDKTSCVVCRWSFRYNNFNETFLGGVVDVVYDVAVASGSFLLLISFFFVLFYYFFFHSFFLSISLYRSLNFFSFLSGFYFDKI